MLEALAGRRVLVTGHSGFKGGWLCLWLDRLGAEVRGISLPPPTDPSFFAATGVDGLVDSRFADIRDAKALQEAAAGFDAEVVFHLAAQPIVRLSHREPADTFATNVVGTANVLDLARSMPSLRGAIVVTSESFSPLIVALRFPLRMPWNWKSCRVVIRIVLFPYRVIRSSQVRYWSAVSTPPGNFVRTISM